MRVYLAFVSMDYFLGQFYVSGALHRTKELDVTFLGPLENRDTSVLSPAA